MRIFFACRIWCETCETSFLRKLLRSSSSNILGRFKMTMRLFFILLLTIAVASQPLETIATSDGATMLTRFLNWAQVGFEAFLVWTRQGFGITTAEVTTTTSASKYCNANDFYYFYLSAPSRQLKNLKEFVSARYHHTYCLSNS